MGKPKGNRAIIGIMEAVERSKENTTVHLNAFLDLLQFINEKNLYSDYSLWRIEKNRKQRID